MSLERERYEKDNTMFGCIKGRVKRRENSKGREREKEVKRKHFYICMFG